MNQKSDHNVQQPITSKLTVFNTFEEMKDAPFYFPPKRSQEAREAESRDVFEILRKSYSNSERSQKKRAVKKLSLGK